MPLLLLALALLVVVSLILGREVAPNVHLALQLHTRGCKQGQKTMKHLLQLTVAHKGGGGGANKLKSPYIPPLGGCCM